MSFRQAAVDYRNYFALNQGKDVMKLKLINPRSLNQETLKDPFNHIGLRCWERHISKVETPRH